MAQKELKKLGLEGCLISKNKANFIVEKIRSSNVYAQNFYAALCNNSFTKKDYEDWGCSWRYAAGMVASFREGEDYMAWYCSGMNRENLIGDSGYDQYVQESVITSEIKKDLKKIGWKCKK